MGDRAPTMQDIDTIKGDIRDIYNRLNDNTAKSNEVMTELRVQMARLTEAMNNLKPAARPCEQFKALQKEFDGHIEEQKKNATIWKSTFVNYLVQYAFIAATIIISMYYTNKR